jgi:hypothetical protein
MKKDRLNDCAVFYAVIVLLIGSSSAIAQSAKPSQRDALGCFDREIHTKLARIANSGDEEAFKKLAEPMVLAGKCQIFERGTMFFLEEYGGVWSASACFRPVGQVACLWMAHDLTD